MVGTKCQNPTASAGQVVTREITFVVCCYGDNG